MRGKNLLFKTPKGMKDILPSELAYYQRVERACQRVAKDYHFQKVSFPVLEEAKLFQKGTGLYTDIVEKQMFLLSTKGGQSLALRPEGTPSVVRLYFQSGLKSWFQPVQLWYFEPFFRHESPQAGRLREFYQVGFEIINGESSALDAYVIQLFYNLLKSLHLKNIMLEINSLGLPEQRKEYQKDLVRYLKSHSRQLCSVCRSRLTKNPLRILDCKEKSCQEVVRQAPQLIDYLSKECHNHFREVLEFLDDLEIPYRLNPYLVRGLDYYTRTVFEFVIEKEGSSSSQALIGGGRYDRLAELIGGERIPALGGAGGIERIIEAMKEQGVRIPSDKKPDIFLAQLGWQAKREALRFFEELRKKGFKVAASLERDSLRAQLKRANQLGVKYTLIIGAEEVRRQRLTLRDMEKGTQKTMEKKEALSFLKKKL
jgi:histidyl-tRNA synthetase